MSIAANVCVCAVVGFRSRHCPRGQTLNEDNTYSLHVTPPLLKHFVVGCRNYSFSFSKTDKYLVSKGNASSLGSGGIHNFTFPNLSTIM
jgi:hypothetical protein